MHKSTIFLAVIALLLLIGTGTVITTLIRTASSSHEPQVEGAFVDLGLGEFSNTLRTAVENKTVTANSAVLWDTKQQTIRFEQNAFERVPIASITKLMTAMVAIDYGLSWDQTMPIELDEYVQGGTLLLHPGEEVRVRDLFTASLLGSANNATLAYVRSLPVDTEEFVLEMNRKAVELGLEQTYFTEVTGLDPRNVSTAYEVARLAEHAFNNYPEIRDATRQTHYTFIVGGSGREHTIRNTNKPVADAAVTVTGSKTGYLYEAQYCLVVQGAGEQADRVAVVLGSPSEPQHFADIERLLQLDVP